MLRETKMDKAWCIFFMAFFALNSLVKAEDFPGYGTCKSCFDGYTGDQCSQPLCYGDTTCNNGGTCSSPNNCTCMDNYVGNRCEQALCFGATTCANGGTCISPDTCSCTSDYTGQKCETENGDSNGGRKQVASAAVVLVLMAMSFMWFET